MQILLLKTDLLRLMAMRDHVMAMHDHVMAMRDHVMALRDHVMAMRDHVMAMRERPPPPVAPCWTSSRLQNAAFSQNLAFSA